jgi:ABC-type sugar transport system ATPase subunit
MIVLQQVSVRAGDFRLNQVSLVLATGAYGVLMGKTGSGKTTLLEAICGLKTVTGGSIHLLGKDVTHLKAAERGIGYVPQDRALFSTMTVRQHLAFALELRRWRRYEIDQRVSAVAEFLNLQHLLSRRPQGLSGGEAQRVALGRALSFAPSVLLLDEPLSALDEETREEMGRLLKRIQTETGVTTLHVTHNRAEAHRLADQLFLLQASQLQALPARDPDSAPEANAEDDDKTEIQLPASVPRLRNLP